MACNTADNACFAKFLELEGGRLLHMSDIRVLGKHYTISWHNDRVDPRLRTLGQRMKNEQDNNSDPIERKRVLNNVWAYLSGVDDDQENILAKEDPNSQVWSFCRNALVSRHRIRHCSQCGVCYENTWHCTTCNTCKFGYHLACDGCGGWSQHGVRYGETNDLAHSASRSQGGPTPTRLPRVHQPDVLVNDSQVGCDVATGARRLTLGTRPFQQPSALSLAQRKDKMNIAPRPPKRAREASPKPMAGLLSEVCISS